MLSMANLKSLYVSIKGKISALYIFVNNAFIVISKRNSDHSVWLLNKLLDKLINHTQFNVNKLYLFRQDYWFYTI